MTHQTICSLIKTQDQVLYEYEKNKCSVIVTAFIVKDKVRNKKISTAVFKYDRDNKWYPHCVEVKGGFKRKGIATVMYNIVQSEIDGVLLPSDEQSEAAKEFWKDRTLRNKWNYI